MKKIDKSINTTFAFALALSIGFPVGILCIIFGAVKGIIALLVIGIVLVVFGFYAMPLLWVRFADKRKDKAFMLMIERDYIYTVQGLSVQTGESEQNVRARIKRLINTHYLVGYLFQDDILQLNTNKKQDERSRRTSKCNQCGAMMYFDGLMFRCDYCGNTKKDSATSD